MFQHNDEPLINPIWMLRVLPGVATVLVGAAMFFKNPDVHSVCLGGAFGLLIGYCVGLTGIEGVTLKNKPQPSDVKQYPLT